MRHIVLLVLVLALTALCGYSQERSLPANKENEPAIPIFPGCDENEGRFDCYMRIIREAIRDKINGSLKDIKVTDLQIELLLRNEKDGKITILTLKGNDPVAEKAARETIMALPLYKPQPVDGKVYVNSKGFYVILSRASATELFVLAPLQNNPDKSPVHQPDIKHVAFPGCEDVIKEELYTCFSNNFNLWISKRLSRKLIRKSAGQRVLLLLDFDEKGNLKEYQIKESKSQELTDELKKIMEEFPSVLPAEMDGKKTPSKFGIPIRF